MIPASEEILAFVTTAIPITCKLFMTVLDRADIRVYEQPSDIPGYERIFIMWNVGVGTQEWISPRSGGAVVDLAQVLTQVSCSTRKLESGLEPRDVEHVGHGISKLCDAVAILGQLPVSVVEAEAQRAEWGEQ